MPTTEILVCPLKAGSNIGDEQNEAAKVLKEVGDRLKSTDGVHSIQFGMQIENPDVFQLLVSKSFQLLRRCHHAFGASPHVWPGLQHDS